MASGAPPKFFNRTRQSRSIPLSLLRRRKLHLLPLFFVAWTSDLGREAMQNSGSYRFADHVYLNRSSGRFFIGRLVDRIFLSTRKARSFRNRFTITRDQLLLHISHYGTDGAEVSVASVPAGVGRELVEASAALKRDHPALFRRTRFYGIDLDPGALSVARELSAAHDVEEAVRMLEGDALDRAAYPAGLHVIVSTGLGEFLSDDLLRAFYSTVHDALVPGGTFITTATAPNPVADYLLENLAELTAYYRHPHDLEAVVRSVPFAEVTLTRDPMGLQTIVIARKAGVTNPPLPEARPAGMGVNLLITRN